MGLKAVARYGPTVTRLDFDETWLPDDLCDWMRVENPAYGSQYADPRDPPHIEFFDRDSHCVLTGLLPAVEAWAERKNVDLEMIGFPVFAAQTIPEDLVPKFSLYPHQVEVIEKSLATGRGIIEAATGSGKTLCAIGITIALGLPKTVYLCPDQASMHQMYRRFLEADLTDEELGRFGDGFRELDKAIVFCVVNSLAQGIRRQQKAVLALLEEAALFFADEVHHQATAETWQLVAASCAADRRLGMSGTPYKDSKSRFHPERLHYKDSWLTGYFGDTIVHISPKELQDQNFLSPCTIVLFRGGGHWIKSRQWTHVYERGIVGNTERNHRIATLAANLHDLGRRPLISVKQLEHGRMFLRQLSAMGVDALCSYGSGVLCSTRRFADRVGVSCDEDAESDDLVILLDDFAFRDYVEAGELVLIGSQIYDEALDLPYLTDFINAAGGKASQRHRQKIGRILRLYRGKREARFWDPWDTCHFYLKAHSKARVKIAQEEGYQVEEANPFYLGQRFRDAGICRREDTMELKEITVGACMTIAIPGYQNLRPSVSLTAKLDEGDDVEKCYEELSVKCTALFYREAWRHAYEMESIHKNGGVVGAAQKFLEGLNKPEDPEGQ